MVKRDWNLLL